MRIGALQRADRRIRATSRASSRNWQSTSFNVLPGGQHALQRAAEQRGLPQARFLEPARRERRRHGRAAGGGRASGSKLTGCPIVEGYGLSETSPVATCNPIRHRASTPARSACRCRPPRSRSSTTPASRCRSAQPGEIAIRGPQVMAGYWNRPDETAKVMTPDGFFKSGDIGIMDERGYTASSIARRT